jgi:chitinase
MWHAFVSDANENDDGGTTIVILFSEDTTSQSHTEPFDYVSGATFSPADLKTRVRARLAQLNQDHSIVTQAKSLAGTEIV